MARELKIGGGESIRIAQYLEGEGLVKVGWVMGGGYDSIVGITHRGIVEVE